MSTEERLSAVETSTREMKTSIAVIENRLSDLDKHLESNSDEAKDDRQGLHNKLDEVLVLVHQRVGGDKVRAASNYMFFGGVGTGIGWMLKGFLGG